MTRPLLILMLACALVSGCEDPSGPPPDPPPPPPPAPAWAVGAFVAPELRSGTTYIPPRALLLEEDGTWALGTEEAVLEQGTFRAQPPRAIELSNGERVELADNCRFVVYQETSYIRTDDIVECPPPAMPALAGVEYCLLGDFAWSTERTGASEHTAASFYDDRTLVSMYSSSSAQGDVASTTFQTWKIAGAQLLRSSSEPMRIDRAFWSLLAAGRITPVDPRCDSPDVCTTTCNPGWTCAEYENHEGCCRPEYPYVCPGIHWCYEREATRNEVCETASYGDPRVACQSWEVEVRVGNRPVCAPTCVSGAACPSAWNRRAGRCVNTTDGDPVCVLPCTDVGVTGGQCPGQMTCTTGGCAW